MIKIDVKKPYTQNVDNDVDKENGLKYNKIRNVNIEVK